MAKSSGGAKWYGSENGAPAMHYVRGLRENDSKPFRGTNWVDMAANSYCVLAVRRDGSLWGAGWNRLGHLGTNGTVEWGANPIAKGRTWSTVAVGWTHAVAVSREGALYGWGENDPDGDDPDKIGHLGLKGVERVGESRQLGSRSDWMDVTASYGLTKQGQIWGWGRSSGVPIGSRLIWKTVRTVGLPPMRQLGFGGERSKETTTSA